MISIGIILTKNLLIQLQINDSGGIYIQSIDIDMLWSYFTKLPRKIRLFIQKIIIDYLGIKSTIEIHHLNFSHYIPPGYGITMLFNYTMMENNPRIFMEA